MFGVSEGRICYIQRGKSYPNESGPVRESKVKRASDEEHAQIKADWAIGLYTKADLARKFGYSHTTISRILRESAE
ncbi:MAG: hypothetical protein IJP68_09995 [Selenomonadaceae bacterium]|nr:hypothetical protein [Selenomonadaceae bacterium]